MKTQRLKKINLDAVIARRFHDKESATASFEEMRATAPSRHHCTMADLLWHNPNLFAPFMVAAKAVSRHNHAVDVFHRLGV